MSVEVSNNINSAIVSGLVGLNDASNGITQASISIAQKAAQLRDPQELVTDAAMQQIGLTSQLLPETSDTLTSDLVSLSVNLTNAQASTKVVETADETVGRLIDIFT